MKPLLDPCSQKLFDASDELMKRREETLERLAIQKEVLDTLIFVTEETIRRNRDQQKNLTRFQLAIRV